MKKEAKRNLKKYSQLESLHEGIWIIDEDANTIFVNGRMAEMLGYSVDEIMGKPFFSFMDEYGGAIVTRALERRKRGIKEQYDSEFLRKDGTSFHALVAASPVYDEEGNYAGAIAGVLDITERKRLEQTLQESEKRYRELADLLPQIVFETNEQDNFTFTNRYGFQATGYTLEDFDKGLHALQVVIPEDRKRLGENMKRILSGEESDGNEYTILRKDGTTFPAIIYSTPITRGDKTVGLRGLVVDITRRKQREVVLRESEEKYRSLFDNMLNGFAYCQILLGEDNQPVDFIYLEVNDALERLTGLRKEDFIGRKVTEIFPGIKEAHPELFSTYGKVALSGGEAKLDIYFEPLEIWLTISVYSPRRGYFVAIFDDITQRKQAEEALRESEQNFRNSIDNSPLGITIIDASGEMIYINQAHLDIWGYSSLEELKAVSRKDRYAPQTFAEVEERLRKRQLGESTANHFQLTIVRKDGEIRYLEVSASEVLWNGKKKYQLLCRDITQRKRAEEVLRQSEARFRFVAETASDAIISIDSQALITFWNRRAETMFGYSGDEIIGQMLTVIIPPRFHARFLEGMKQLNLGADLSFIGMPWETLGLRKDGSEFPSELSLAMWELNGKTFFTSIVRDITQRRTAQ